MGSGVGGQADHLRGVGKVPCCAGGAPCRVGGVVARPAPPSPPLASLGPLLHARGICWGSGREDVCATASASSFAPTSRALSLLPPGSTRLCVPRHLVRILPFPLVLPPLTLQSWPPSPQPPSPAPGVWASMTAPGGSGGRPWRVRPPPPPPPLRLPLRRRRSRRGGGSSCRPPPLPSAATATAAGRCRPRPCR